MGAFYVTGFSAGFLRKEGVPTHAYGHDKKASLSLWLYLAWGAETGKWYLVDKYNVYDDRKAIQVDFRKYERLLAKFISSSRADVMLTNFRTVLYGLPKDDQTDFGKVLEAMNSYYPLYAFQHGAFVDVRGTNVA